MDKLNMHTANKVNENFAKLAQLFPNAVTESIVEGEVVRSIDKDVLMQEISANVVEGKAERYQFTWPDKKKSVLLANTPSYKTLRPVIEDETIPTGSDSMGNPYSSSGSVDFDTTENLYIEGDNLDVLKLLQETYLGKIKMIYIDPPYNTGKDFVYSDKFKQSVDEYMDISGELDEEGNRLFTNSETNGRYHTDWLNMMYPRLRLAKDLLKDDGVIFINMDEHEIFNLQKICNEIFGEWNDLGTIVWDKRNPKGDARGVSYQHEYICVYAKNIEMFVKYNEMKRPKKNAMTILKKANQLFARVKLNCTLEQINIDFSSWINAQGDFTGGEKAYNKIDENGNVFQSVSMAWPNKKQAPDDYFIPLIHPLTKKTCPVPEKGWRNPSSTMRDLLSNNLILFGKDETTQPRRKYFLKENLHENIPSLLYYGGSDIDMLNGFKIPFDTPKAVDVCKEHLQAFVKENDIILDFFSGSATIAHAAMKLNADDGGNRKFIMVQLPEIIDEKHEAYKAGYRTICEIGKERIRRAGVKIKEENKDKEGIEKLDTGFRVFKVDTSNMKDIYYEPNQVTQSLLDMYISNVKEDRNQEDLLFQVMLDLGILLSNKIETEIIEGKKIFTVYQGDIIYLIACFENDINTEVVTAIAKRKPYYAVFKDQSMENDSLMNSFEQIFKAYSKDTIRKVM